MIYVKRAILLLMLLGGIGIVGLERSPSVFGQQTGGQAKDDVIKLIPQTRIDWTQKVISFEMRDKKWSAVFEWLADQTGMPFSSVFPPPAGTLTFINPTSNGQPRTYTLAEVFDVINEILQSQTKHTLIRRELTLTMVPADAVPKELIPRVLVPDLPKRSRTEVVEVVIQLKDHLNAVEVAADAKRLFGEFAHVTPLDSTNQLIIQAPVAMLMRNMEIFLRDEEGDKNIHNFTYQCKYIRAATAEQVIVKALGYAQIIDVQKGGQKSSDPRQPGSGPSTTRTIKQITVTSNKATNQIFISGPADKIATAKVILEKLDAPSGKAQTLLIGPPIFQNHDLPSGSADAMAKILIDYFKEDSTIRVAATGPTRLFVYADPQTHFEIGLIIGQTTPPAQKPVSIQLNRLDAFKFIETLKEMFPESAKGAPFLSADVDSNTIRIRGTDDQIKIVTDVIRAFDGNPFGGAGGIRTINLDKASGATVAEALHMLFGKLRDNEMKLILPSSAFDVKPENKSPEPKKAPTPDDKKGAVRLTPDKVRELMHLSKDDMDERNPNWISTQPVEEKRKIDPKKPPIVITAFGNRIVIASEDIEALDLAQQLIRILVNTEAGPGDFEVLRLRYASANEVAKILDEAFNGPKGQGGPSGGKGGGGGGGGFNPLSLVTGVLGMGSGSGGGGSARIENIRVVADPATNALLIKARPVDMLTIRRLIATSLDIRNVDSEAVVRTFAVPIKHANANEVADIIRQVYADAMNVRPQQSQQGAGGFPGFSFGPRPVDAAGIDRKVMLSLGVDIHTNSLYVACPTTMFKEVKELIDQIEIASKDQKQAIRIVSVKDIDPVSLAQAIEAITGRSTSSGQRQSGGIGSTPGGFGSGFRTGGFGTGGGGGGGFTPGGGGGFTPGGGGGLFPGFTPGGGGGFSPGGGGGTRPGGGAGIRPGGGGKSGADTRGLDFFEQRVMDDPSVARLFDPSETQEAPLTLPYRDNPKKTPVYTTNPIHYTGLFQDKEVGEQPEPKGKDLKDSGDITPPRLGASIEVLEQLGILILRANNKEDADAILRIIELLRKTAQPATIDIQLVPVRFGDPTSITNTLNLFFSRLNITPYATSIIPGGIRPGGGATPGGGGGGGGTATPQSQATATGQAGGSGNVILIPQPRLGAILVAATKARMPDIIKEIQRLDQLPSDVNSPVAFPLKRATASRVATALNSFYAVRFPIPEGTNNQVRITWDDNSNTIFVQASPGDLVDIRNMIEFIDTTPSAAKNEIRVVRLRSAVALDLAQLLGVSIANNALVGSSQQSGLGGALGGLGQGGGGLGGIFGGQGGGGLGGLGGQQQQGLASKNSVVKFVGSDPKNGKPVESSILEDIRINPDQRTNSLLISAPEKTMALVLALIKDLDIAPSALSKINIFTLKKSDATQLALTLQQLFVGSGGLGTTARTGVAGGLGAGGLGGQGAAGAATGQARPLQITIQNTSPDGAPIIDLRLTVDERTNSLIVAGSQNDLDVVESIIAKLEDANIQERRQEAIRLRNSQAVDVANALADFLKKSYDVSKNYNQGTNFQQLQREVVVVAEPISNSLLISATSKYFDDLIRIVAQLDTAPPQVVIQVLIAEVSMNGSEEFGMELGLQAPLLFRRGIPGAAGTATYQTFTPGYNFNSTGPLGDNALESRSGVGIQGIGNLGVGRASPTNNVGGFVFSAASDSVSVLIRALKIQGRINVLSRPQITTLDNQTAYMNVGKDIPILTNSTQSINGVTQNIERKQVGVILQVTPKITPDGRVIMRVIPEVSSVVETPVNLGNGTVGTALNVQHLETTVISADGETILLGGLITKREEKNENKIPILGDLPGIGAAFRYRTYTKSKTELIIIMTPHIIRNRAETDQILADESRRIDWSLSDVMRVHGNANSLPFMPNVMPEPHRHQAKPFRIYPAAPGGAERAPSQPELAPQPQIQPQTFRSAVPPRTGLLKNIFGKRNETPDLTVAPTTSEPQVQAFGPAPQLEQLPVLQQTSTLMAVPTVTQQVPQQNQPKAPPVLDIPFSEFATPPVQSAPRGTTDANSPILILPTQRSNPGTTQGREMPSWPVQKQ